MILLTVRNTNTQETHSIALYTTNSYFPLSRLSKSLSGEEGKWCCESGALSDNYCITTLKGKVLEYSSGEKQYAVVVKEPCNNGKIKSNIWRDIKIQ
jgi:hypothetical protein